MASPHTAEEFERIWNASSLPGQLNIMPLRAGFFEMLVEQIAEPWPHLVHYEGDKARHTPPDYYRFTRHPKGPSDCTWMVPGTGQRK